MNFLICPICAAALAENAQGLFCQNRHQFDRAREGYFNLLPVQFKHSREPGDAKQQLQARRTFLNAHFFQPLVELLKQSIPADTKSLLDIGCGEGYFTRAFSEHCVAAQVCGVDIAKAAVKMGAKSAAKGITYVVASSYALPVADASMDVITRIYAPSKDEELLRVLKPSGRLIIVTPGENHLLGLRRKIYQQIRPHPEPKTPVGFRELDSTHCRFPLQVPAGDMSAALLQMTPFAWRMKSELLEELTQVALCDQADFHVTVYQPL